MVTGQCIGIPTFDYCDTPTIVNLVTGHWLHLRCDTVTKVSVVTGLLAGFPRFDYLRCGKLSHSDSPLMTSWVSEVGQGELTIMTGYWLPSRI
jgi:hypothetical protein